MAQEEQYFTKVEGKRKKNGKDGRIEGGVRMDTSPMMNQRKDKMSGSEAKQKKRERAEQKSQVQK